tara:strand:+ start:18947 stop:19522 length:576 start_codon:yes stop_codon:yes gene_type:complete
VKKILLLLADGFEILEASAFIDVMGWNLKEGDYSTQLFTCAQKKKIKSSFDQTFIVDFFIEQIDISSFDALAIPGGFKEYNYYKGAYSENFLKIITSFNKLNKIIATVCVGALPLGKSGALKNKNGTTYNSFEYKKELKSFGVNLMNEPIVEDGNLITSSGPSTAIEVAFILLEKLTNKENTKKVRKLMGF